MPIRKYKLQIVVRQCGYKGNALSKYVLVKGVAAEHIGGNGFERVLWYLLRSTVFFAFSVISGTDPSNTGGRGLAAVVFSAETATYLASEGCGRAGFNLNAVRPSDKLLLYCIKGHTVDDRLVGILNVVHGKLSAVNPCLLC